MKSLIVICDMDGITTDLVEKWLRLYNADHGTNLTRDFHSHWDFHKCVPTESKKVYEYFNEGGFFADLLPIPGAKPALEKISKAGHDIVIASAPAWPGTSASDKLDWIRKHLPFVDKKSVFLGHKKHLLKGDVFIDDSPTNILKYRESWPKSRVMTIAYPYNVSAKNVVDVYAEDYKNTERAWEQICSAILKYGEELDVRGNC